VIRGSGAVYRDSKEGHSDRDNNAENLAYVPMVLSSDEAFTLPLLSTCFGAPRSEPALQIADHATGNRRLL
jgi:hypothetical protein